MQFVSLHLGFVLSACWVFDFSLPYENSPCVAEALICCVRYLCPIQENKVLFNLCFLFKIYILRVYTHVIMWHKVSFFFIWISCCSGSVYWINIWFVVTHFKILFVACVWCGGIGVAFIPWCARGDQKTSFRSWLAPSTLVWVPDIRSAGLLHKCFYLTSHPSRPSVSLFEAPG